MAAAADIVLETLGRPEYPAAVHWSEDNLLATAAGPGVIIVNPCRMRGPRALTVLPESSMSFLEVDQYPEDCQESSTYSATYLRTRGMCQQRNSQIASSRLGVRSVSWSPRGCDVPGNALLTSVTENHEAGDLLWCSVTCLTLPACPNQKPPKCTLYTAGEGPRSSNRLPNAMADSC